MSKYWHLRAGKMKVFSLGFLILSVLAVNAHAQFLGSAGNFAVLGASEVTNTLTGTGSTLTGYLGVSPGPLTSITGLSNLTVNGVNGLSSTNVYSGAVALLAQNDATTAYNALAGLSSGTNLTGTDLGGLVLTCGTACGGTGNGVYNFSSSAGLTGALTLNFAGLSDQNIVFQIGSSLTTASASSVVIEGANSTDNVFWQVGSSATLGTTTAFVGNIIALTSVTMDTLATDLCGSVIARNAAVTLDNNTISNTCTATGGGGGIGGGTGGGPVPEGGSTLLYLCSFLVPLGAMRVFRFRRSI